MTNHAAKRPWQRAWWQGEPSFRRRPLRWLVWLFDEALDRIPAVSLTERHFYFAGGWGCRLGLSRFWARRDQ